MLKKSSILSNLEDIVKRKRKLLIVIHDNPIQMPLPLRMPFNICFAQNGN